MKKILLVGGGGHAHSVIDIIEENLEFKIAGIIEPVNKSRTDVLGYPILGEDSNIEALLVNIPYGIVSVGQIKSAKTRKKLFGLLSKFGAKIPNIVSKYAYISKRSSFERGSVILHGSVVNSGAKIGSNVIINNMALIDHDVTIGDHTHISTGARINGYVSIENECFIGSGAILKQGIKIGANSFITAGSLVTKDLAPNTYFKE